MFITEAQLQTLARVRRTEVWLPNSRIRTSELGPVRRHTLTSFSPQSRDLADIKNT
ncbi:hypothetical protein BABINDRAFT_160986 [Babjeviella inositovora NRRL Y-12698]|uniref:Uncharacterized protein n=1 Tax=Babjeviella inositovora NRRL Y-12698 TaxID=984486 RepID=A0A1E3QST4_9ASCO|nr:uncharacterized protein BABINDRAFT_160986 [Babjeviella inositovora NRRL Y-12698]ODQ80773.1 hypothetical protein BABINDRAFT_160986 [Babjeviella inositovora NRRL Y-12698]